MGGPSFERARRPETVPWRGTGTGRGRPLPASLRESMEDAFGTNFRRVRVVEGDHVPALGFVAFTRGEEVHVGRGGLVTTAAARHLFAHELAHVVQQRHGRATAPGGRANTVLDDTSLEREADQLGARAARGMAAPVPGTVAASSAAAAPVQGVKIRVNREGKVHYYARDSWGDWWRNRGTYMTMKDNRFKTWKGAGKRRPSSKLTDPSTARSYVHDPVGDTYFSYDKTVADRRGAAVSKTSGWIFRSAHAALKAKHQAGQLIDRTRLNRTAAPLEPFDVGPYQADVTIGGTTYPKLPTAKGVWTANNDHSPSGESLKRRNPGALAQTAYKTGATIAIDNPVMHATHSPTYTGKQKSWDTDATGTQRQRVDYDTAHPATAFTRDVFHMLDATQGLNLSTKHPTAQPTLNLKKRKNRVRQMGAYRNLYRMNTRMHQHFGAGRGIDPNAPGQTATNVPKPGGGMGSFTYADVPGKVQGDLIVSGLRQRLLNEGLAK